VIVGMTQKSPFPNQATRSARKHIYEAMVDVPPPVRDPRAAVVVETGEDGLNLRAINPILKFGQPYNNSRRLRA
jgi:hypothetical protein